MDGLDQEQGTSQDEFLDVEGWSDDHLVMPTTGHTSVTLSRDCVLQISIPRRRRRRLEFVLERTGEESRLDDNVSDHASDLDDEQPECSSSVSSTGDDKLWSLLPRQAPIVIRSEAKILDQEAQGEVEQGKGNSSPCDAEPSQKVVDLEEGDTSAIKASSKVVRFAAPEQMNDGSSTFATTPEDFHDGEAEEEEEEVEPNVRALRFAAIEKPYTTSPDGEAAKRGVRFLVEKEEEPDEEERASTKLVKFADALVTPKKKKSVRFARGTAGPDTKSKSVRFAGEVGDKRNFSILESPKVVRFLLPALDPVSGKERMRVFLPGVQHRVRRNTIKHCSTVKVYPDPPLSLVLRLMETERFLHFSGRSRTKAWHVLARVGAVLFVAALVVCMVVLTTYLHLRPRIPHLRIEDFDVVTSLWSVDYDELAMQQQEDLGKYYFYRALVYGMFMVNYGNLNHAIDLHNEYVESSIFYNGVFLGKSHLRNFVVPRKTNMPLEFEFDNELLLPLQVGYTLLKEIDHMRLSYVCEFIIKARMSSLGSKLTSRLFWHRVRCYIVLAENTIVEAAQQCKDYNY